MKKVYIIIAAIFAAVVVAGAAFFVFSKSKKAYAVEEVLAEGPMAYLYLSKLTERVERFAATKFWQDLKAIDYPSAAGTVGFAEQAQNVQKSLQTAFSSENVEFLKALFGQEVAVAIYSDDNFKNLKTADPLQSITELASNLSFVTRLGPKMQAAESLSRFFAQFDKDLRTQTTSYQGQDIQLISSKDGKITIGYVRFGDLLIFGLGEKAARSAIDTVSGKKKALKSDAIYAERKKAALADADSLGFVRLETIYNLLREQINQLAGTQGPASTVRLQQLEEQFKQTQGIESVVFSSSSGDMINGKANLYFDPNRLHPDMRALYTCAPIENRSEKFVPWDAMFYQWGNCLDFTALYSQYKKEIDAQAQAVGKPPIFDQMIGAYENMLGLSVTKDILPALGKEFGMYLTDINATGNFPIPKLVAFVEITDEKKIVAIINQLLTLQPGLRFEEEQYNGTSIHYISIPIADQFKFGYTFIGNYFLLTSNTDILKDSLDAFNNPGKSVTINSAYQHLSTQAGKRLNSVFFLKFDSILQKVSALLDWSLRATQQSLEQRQAFLTGSQKNLADLKTKETDLNAKISAQETQFATAQAAADPSAESIKTQIDALKQELAANRDRQANLQEMIKSYETKAPAPPVNEQMMTGVIKPLFKVFSNIKTLSSAMINREGSIESVTFFKME